MTEKLPNININLNTEDVEITLWSEDIEHITENEYNQLINNEPITVYTEELHLSDKQGTVRDIPVKVTGIAQVSEMEFYLTIKRRN